MLRLWYSSHAPKRRAVRWIVLGLLVAILLVPAAIWGPRVLRQGVYLQKQRKCLNLRLPPTKTVYEQDPALARKLLANATDYHAPQNQFFLVPQPSWWSPPAYYRPPIFAEIGYLRGQAQGMAFCHERRTARGLGRLVVVWVAEVQIDDVGRTVFIQARIETPATWKPGSRLTRCTDNLFYGVRVYRQQTLRIFAGQPDDADASHFTIGYELDGKRGTIDGWLRNPGQRVHLTLFGPVCKFESIQLKVRDGPLRFKDEY